MRSLILALLVVSTGCKTTGGKVFGTVSLATTVGAGYLLLTSRVSTENAMLDTRNDHSAAGVGLMFAAVLASAGWFVCETIYGQNGCGGGPGYSSFPSTPAVAQGAPATPPVAPAAPVAPVAPAAPVAPVVDPADPAAAPAAEGERASGGPVVVQGRGPDERDSPSRGWRFDPRDGQHKLYGPSGEFMGSIDPRGGVWGSNGSYLGRVAMSPNCGVACKRSQAYKMLRGIPMNH